MPPSASDARAGLTLADVGSSALAALGDSGAVDALGIGPSRHVVVCLIDGLGWQALLRHPDAAPFMTAAAKDDPGPIRAAFPTTTPVGLGTFGTALPPGAHGLVGASFWLPETDEVLTPLHWGAEPTPVAVQPERTIFERSSAAGIRTSAVSPGAYRESGLTRAVLRGGAYESAESITDRVAIVAGIVEDPRPSFTYVYWPELDRTGHEFGVASEEWRQALGRADALVAGLAEACGPGSSLVVTADHGMVDCPSASRIPLEDDPALMTGVRLIAGEPRARHVYTQPGAEGDVAAVWRETLGDRATVLSRAEVVRAGLLGEVDPDLADRVGDIVVIARGDTLMASHVDPLVSGLVGQHGAMADDEVLIPGLVLHGG